MVSEARKKANAKYDAKAYYRISTRIRKENEEQFLQAVQKSGLSKNTFILQAINEYMKKFE